MSVEALARDEPVTTAWITRTLRRAGQLPQGRAVSLQQRSNEAFNSLVVHLDVCYSEDAPSSAPTALLLKRAEHFSGELEVAFYREVSTAEDGTPFSAGLPMLVACYDAAFDPHSGASHLLLRDISGTHRPPVTRKAVLAGDGVPSRSHLDAIMRSLGTFHARWWGDPRLGGEGIFAGRWYASDTTLAEHVARRRSEWTRFVSEVGETLAADLHRLYDEALKVLDGAWDMHLAERVSRRKGMTLTHGDCYFTQWLCPMEGQTQIYLIDFDSVSSNLGAFDLAFLLPTFWLPPQRRAHETRCLRLYHDSLKAAGIEDYRWEDLLTDYRWMIAFMVFDPVFDQTNGSSRDYWWPKMKSLTASYREWDCTSLGTRD